MRAKEREIRRPLAVIVSGNSVAASYEPRREGLSETDRKLLSITISMNKLAELLYNGEYDKETIFECPALLLITKSNYMTKVNIQTGKTSFILAKKEQKCIPLNKDRNKRYGKRKNLFEQSRVVFYVAEDHIIKKGDLHHIPER